MSLFPSLKDPKRDTTAAKEAAGARSEGIVTSPRQAFAVKYSCTKKNKYNPARKHFKSAQKNIMSFPSSHFLTLFWFTFSGRSPLFLLLLHDELSGQCFLAWRRILKGAAQRPPTSRLWPWRFVSRKNTMVCGKTSPLRLKARNTRAARCVIWRLRLFRLHFCIYIPFWPDNRFATLEYISSTSCGIASLQSIKYSNLCSFFFYHPLCTYTGDDTLADANSRY